MIISASRRTDIPCFYMDWFLDKINQGFLYTKNPFNRKQVKKISLNPEHVDCIIFWTKNPQEFLKKKEKINQYNYYFQYTLNAYNKDLETNIPNLDSRIRTFNQLSEKIGKDRIVWRYDPIVLSRKYNEEFHLEKITYISEKVKNYTDECIFSYVTPYKKIEKILNNIGYIEKEIENLQILANKLKKICKNNNIILKNCCNNIQDIEKAACIDKNRIEKICNKKIEAFKDGNQRENCNCLKSVDIGIYNTCLNGCLYCYANSNQKLILKNNENYDVKNPILCYKLRGDEIIKNANK